MAISVIGFCRPVNTFASLMGVANGKNTEEMRIQAIWSSFGFGRKLSWVVMNAWAYSENLTPSRFDVRLRRGMAVIALP
ncbi:MAG: hypothetical protein WBA83_02590 [Burkholderiaceae bacterium]